MDGIGGSSKRYVWNAVKTRKFQVNNVASFTAASKTMPNVEVMERGAVIWSQEIWSRETWSQGNLVTVKRSRGNLVTELLLLFTAFKASKAQEQ